MVERINLTKDHISIVGNEYGYFVQIFFCEEFKEKAKQLKEQILKDQTIANSISVYAETDNLSIHELLIKYEQYKKVTQRVKLEHTKFAGWGFDGLQENGKSQLHLLNFCLNGKLPYEMKYNFCIKNCGRRTDTENKICRMCKGWNN